MRKNKKIVLLVSLLSIILLGIFEYSGVVNILPVSKYQKNTEQINLRGICEEIKDNQSKKLCFSVQEENDFEKGLALINKEKKYFSKDYPWYDFPFYSSLDNYHNFPGGMKEMLTEGKKHNSEEWCRNVYLSYTPLKEDYYFCRAFLENPNFCSKIYYPVGPSKGVCYQDAALIWKDSLLCQKAEDQDFCYLRIVLSYLEDSKTK
ncbi:hypothetical protein KJ695_01875 [Patescibacteria group bacterium]|nr:hypothetical protein [Patescibacteria group bacterium]MBU4056640.1 hypothetical protein [Patescibacteria group bacterium]MBU4368333.1 hypothetical protein [Patescibacteria group bacterium]